MVYCRLQSTFTWSVFNRTLLFNLRDILLGVFVIREIAVGDRWSLFQKCKIAECLVFIEFDFRYCDIFFKWKGCFCQVSLSTIHLFFYIRMFSKNLSRNLKKYVLKKLAYNRAKTFVLYCIYDFIIYIFFSFLQILLFRNVEILNKNSLEN